MHRDRGGKLESRKEIGDGNGCKIVQEVGERASCICIGEEIEVDGLWGNMGKGGVGLVYRLLGSMEGDWSSRLRQGYTKLGMAAG